MATQTMPVGDRGTRHLSDQRHRLPRVLRRERQAGGALLSGAFGFQLVAYRGPETGVRDRVSYLLDAEQDSPRADVAARA